MDVRRVGIYGASHGGYLTMRALLMAPDVYHVGVSLAGATDRRDNAFNERFLGLPDDNRSGYEFAETLRLAPRLKGKLLLGHGTHDTNIGFPQAMKMVEALARAGKLYDLLVLPKESHRLGWDMSRYFDTVRTRYASSSQVVGLRFTDIAVTPGARIEEAHLQFTALHPGLRTAELTIHAELATDAECFIRSDGNISTRPQTASSVRWSPPPWEKAGERSVGQRSPDISCLVQEIVARPDWKSGNSLVFLVSGSGRRVAHWPGVIKPGTVSNDIFSHLDWMPTLLAAAGEPGIKEKLLKGHEAAGKKFKVHLDGYDQTALLKGEGPGARKEIFYITDDGDLSAVRHGKWKIMFNYQKSQGLAVWKDDFVNSRMPLLIDLHADPFEQAVQRGASYEYGKWGTQRMYAFVPAQAIVARFLKSFEEFPPRQKPGSFSVGDALSQLQTASQGK